MDPLRMYSLGFLRSAGASSARLAYSSSMRSIQYGAQPQPASRKARRRRGKRSGTPPSTIDVSRRRWATAGGAPPVGGKPPADVAQLADGAPQFERGGLGILDGQERDGLEPGADLDELLVHERVVGAAEPHGPL